MKRKRALRTEDDGREAIKRCKDDGGPSQSCAQPDFTHHVLQQYYQNVTTLRQYLLLQLPATSKWRRKRISAVPQHSIDATNAPPGPAPQLGRQSLRGIVEQRQTQALSKLLDTALVGSSNSTESLARDDSLSQELLRFTQQQRATAVSASGKPTIEVCQEELVDFVIGRLFGRIHPRERYPPHVLCHGYSRTYQHNLTAEDQGFVGGIHGLDCLYPNPYVATLKSGPWRQLLRLVSREGDAKLMLDLLLGCGIFLPLETGNGNYYQLCGNLLSDMSPLSKAQPLPATASRHNIQQAQEQRCPADITFVRNRMMHGRAALNRFNETRFGLPHIHVLNKCKDTSSDLETRYVAMHVFPRQFGLHNVFTSTVNRRETAQPFKDYSLRGDEIKKATGKMRLGKHGVVPVPRRLRGPCLELVRKFRVRHLACSYHGLLKHYCSVSVLDQRPHRKLRRGQRGLKQPHAPMPTLAIEGAQKSEQQHFVDFATPTANVSAYCRAVLSSLIPNDFFGIGDDGTQNRRSFMHNVHLFIVQNRFEKINLHSLAQKQKISSIPWLDFLHAGRPGRHSLTDMKKREELYLEFLYYTFDSILIPLLRSTFHITESMQHGNRLFFFRHDLWRALVEPTIKELKLSTFVEIPKGQAVQQLNERKLGVGHVRLVPKGTGVRMITNLRRKDMVKRNGRTELGRSVNTQLEPVHCMLKCERAKSGAELGGSLFSADEVHPRLKVFRDSLLQKSSALPKLYFAKVDVKSCFDTIPQEELITVLRRLCSEEAYSKYKYLELRSSTNRPRKFVSSAETLFAHGSLNERVATSGASRKRGRVFTDIVMAQVLEKPWLMDTLIEHIQKNTVRIGKKHYQQRCGIPQGSVLSTLLCNFFYADFENRQLTYLEPQKDLLLRLIDDFLLVTTDRDIAVRFVEQMHLGCQDYGIQVRPEKTLTNFEWSNNSPAALCQVWFPFCGTLIKIDTLELSRDRSRRLGGSLRDAITTERSARVGANFVKKILHAFRIQTTAMVTDLSLNSQTTVLTTLYLNFVETAMKMHRYIKILEMARPIEARVMIGAILGVNHLARAMTKERRQSATSFTPGREGVIGQWKIERLLVAAFTHVLKRKQSRYVVVLDWLERRRRSLRQKDASGLTALVRRANAVHDGYRY